VSASRDDLQLRRVLLDSRQMAEAIRHLAHQLVQDVDVSTLALVGVRTRGVPLARRLQTMVYEIEGVRPPVGELDITLYRDDVFHGMAIPEVRPTHLPFEMANKSVVLVDDVLYTGRTVRAALDGIMDWGRPRSIKLAVLVDRGHRELPIQGDYVGLSLTTAPDESIQVRLAECDETDEVLLWGRAGDSFDGA
jgi:pyrimidine operon attenuation protein/uracil phosphoribosyltransferase